MDRKPVTNQDEEAVERRTWAERIASQFEVDNVDAIEEGIQRGAMLALTRTPPASDVGWQPIETAPRDGTPLILFARAKTATASSDVIGWFIDGGWIECCFAPNKPVGIVPSHWMPRPGFPPSTPEQET